MLQKIFGSRRSRLFVLAGIILLALLAVTWRIVSLQKAASKVDVEPVLKIGYCGTEPDELCILSFGRDLDENMVVNIFSPNRKFPEFYVKIKRLTGESIYECEKDKEVRTNVFCYGEMVNLQEKIEVSLFAKEDEHLIAAGDFTLKALLISEPPVAENSEDIPTLEAAVKEIPTPGFNTSAATATPTPTPDASYPDPSYPNPSYP